MKNRRNKIGYGLLSLALALAFPLNALADEITDEHNENETADTLINEEDINLQDNRPTPVTLAPRMVNTTPTPTPRENIEKNTNYISQQGKVEEDKIEVTPYPVEFKEELEGAKNVTYLTYSFGIKGDDLPKEYTISVFALKNSQVKNLKIDNFIAEDKVSSTSEEIEKAAEKIQSDDVFGVRIKTEITYSGSVKAVVRVDENEDPGDYSIYYVVSKDDKSTLGKIDANLGKSGDYNFYLSRDEVTRDYENYTDEKVNPLANLPFTKYLLNDTDEEKKLSNYVDLTLPEKENYKFVATFINPNTLETKKEEITDLESYAIPANSLAKFDVREKSDTENLIKDSEIITYKFETTENKDSEKIETIVVKKDTPEGKSEQAKEANNLEDLIKVEKVSLKKANPDIDEENLEIKALSQTIKKQNTKLKEMILEGDKAKIEKVSLNEEGPSVAKANALKLLEEQKKSILELEPEIDEVNLDVRGLSQAIRVQNKKIEDLIQQAFLNYELDSLTKLEKENPEKATEEYKKIAELVKEAKETNKKANDKLVELDEIILIDNTTDPLMKRVTGAKPVLNLGMLTPLTKIENLTKDSPKESERNFSTNLQKKLDAATEKIKKVQTVTITEKDDKKAGDKKETTNKDKKETKEEKKQTEVNTPIFVRYLKLSNKGK